MTERPGLAVCCLSLSFLAWAAGPARASGEPAAGAGPVGAGGVGESAAVGASDAASSRAPTDAEIDAFRAEAGASWRARRDERTGFVRFLWGGGLAPSI